MLQNAPKEVGSRGRLYTTARERDEIDDTRGVYGHKTPVHVVVKTVDRGFDSMIYEQSVTFRTKFGYYGSIQIPREARQVLDIDRGDHVRLTVGRRNG